MEPELCQSDGSGSGWLRTAPAPKPCFTRLFSFSFLISNLETAINSYFVFLKLVPYSKFSLFYYIQNLKPVPVGFLLLFMIHDTRMISIKKERCDWNILISKNMEAYADNIASHKFPQHWHCLHKSFPQKKEKPK